MRPVSVRLYSQKAEHGNVLSLVLTGELYEHPLCSGPLNPNLGLGALFPYREGPIELAVRRHL
jgi:hypothetical protein